VHIAHIRGHVQHYAMKDRFSTSKSDAACMHSTCRGHIQRAHAARKAVKVVIAYEEVESQDLFILSAMVYTQVSGQPAVTAARLARSVQPFAYRFRRRPLEPVATYIVARLRKHFVLQSCADDVYIGLQQTFSGMVRYKLHFKVVLTNFAIIAVLRLATPAMRQVCVKLGASARRRRPVASAPVQT